MQQIDCQVDIEDFCAEVDLYELKDDEGEFVMVFVASGVLIGVEFMLARVVARVLYKDDIIISYADLPEYIDRTASTKDIDELINKTFGE